MARKTSTTLFDLIHSMTQAEKRLFKLSLSKSDKKGPLHNQLFDLINQQKVYDENQLKLKLYGAKPLKTNKFFVLKHELYKRILKTLAQNFEEQSAYYKVQQQLMQVQVLYSKLLIDACRDILEQSYKLALEYELYSLLFEILKWKKKVAYVGLDTEFLDQELKTINDEENSCLKKLKSQSDYWFLFLDQLVLTRKQTSNKNKEKQERLELARKHPLLLCPEPKDSFESALFYYFSKSLLSYNENNIKAFHKYSKAALDYIEKRPSFKEEELSFYISLLGNYVVACLLLKKFREAASKVREMKPTKPLAPSLQYRMLNRYYSCQLTICSETGTFKEGLELMRTILKEEKRTKLPFSKDNYLFFAYFNFGLRQFDPALEWLNRYLGLPKKQIRNDLESACRILQLIICFEQKNTLHLESLYRSTYRYLKKNERFFGIEKLLLQFIKKNASLYSEKQKKVAFVNFKKEINALSENQDNINLLDYINLIAWADSHIQKKSFVDLVMEDANLK